MSTSKKELILLTLIFIILTFAIHYEELFTSPTNHFSNLSNSGAYGIGFIHPIVFTLLVYMIVSLPRLVFKFIKNGIKKA